MNMTGNLNVFTAHNFTPKNDQREQVVLVLLSVIRYAAGRAHVKCKHNTLPFMVITKVTNAIEGSI